MRIEQHIVAAWARQLSDKLIKDSIAALEQMDANEMLSGDDSGLKNVWEEICVQVQQEESIFWDAYLETMEGLLTGFVELLDREARMALWAVTDEGSDYVDDHQADTDGVRDVPVSEDEIVSKLKDGLLSAAANYSNSRITKFLARHEDGYDELEEDEDDEDLDDDGAEEQAETTKRFFDLRPAVADPVVFVITRQLIDDVDVESSLDFLRSLVPVERPEHAWAYKGRLSLMISGYDSDPRELYEISEVCHYLRALDAEWPFCPQRFYSVSAQIQRERKDYYEVLERTQKGSLDVTGWLSWFLGTLGRAVASSQATLDAVLVKARFWQRCAGQPLNERQVKLLNRLLDGFDGKLTSSKWAVLAKCSPDTALRDITQLLDFGVLQKTPGGGRSTGYELAG